LQDGALNGEHARPDEEPGPVPRVFPGRAGPQVSEVQAVGLTAGMGQGVPCLRGTGLRKRGADGLVILAVRLGAPVVALLAASRTMQPASVAII